MKRFSIVSNGYDIDEVNNFVDVVIKRLERLNSENNNYLNELNKIKEEKSKSDNSSNDITKAIIAANETANRMKMVAKEEAELIVSEAKDNATSIVHEALVEAEKTEQKRLLLEKDINVYLAKIKSLTESQLELIKDMEK